MKFILLFVLVYWSSGLRSQTPIPTDTMSVTNDFDNGAAYKGGFKKLAKYISKNLDWDEVMKWPAALKVPFEDKVIVRVVVEIDGSLTHIQIESATSYCPPCNKEAIRLVQQMPKWKPATKNGEPVRIWVQVPINFQVY